VRPTSRPTLSRAATARPSAASDAGKQLGRAAKFGGEMIDGAPRARAAVSAPCVLPFRRDPRTGECRIFIGAESGRDRPAAERAAARGTAAAAAPVGDAVMGRYGAALAPGSMMIDRAVCLRGMQLGNDGLCYNKSQISNKQRMWPKGRAPLLTGGEMRAISIAARAGSRVEKATERLRKLGMVKQLPKPRAAKGKTVVVHADHHA